MKTTTLRIRRTLTLVGAVAAVVLGFAAIQVAAAWTAQAAPLTVSPTSAPTVEARLADEQARSAALLAQLHDLSDSTDSLATALAAAQDQITTDKGNAAQLESDLAAATKKLQDLQKSITRNGRQALAATTVAAGSQSGGGDGAQEHYESGDD